MNRQTHPHVGLALIAALLLSTATQVGATPFDQLIVIGDSLSDTGNDYARSHDFIPASPYWEGRFSNGPTWVEGLAGALGLPEPAAYFGSASSGRTNLAHGGATTGPKSEFFGEIGMDWQVDQLAADTTITGLSESLFAVWGGANDFFDDINADPADSVDNLVTIVDELIGLGAESLLLVNLPPIDQTPDYRGKSGEAAAAAFSLGFDVAYRAAVDELKIANSGVVFYYFDVYGVFQEVLSDPATFGFTNITDSAFNGSTVVPDPDDYLFWDGVHPTRAGHAHLGALAAELVPVPPVLPLLSIGFAWLIGARAKWRGQSRRG